MNIHIKISWKTIFILLIIVLLLVFIVCCQVDIPGIIHGGQELLGKWGEGIWDENIWGP